MSAECPTTARVIKRMEDRAAKAMVKFGVTIPDNKRPTAEWLRELQEELLDGAVYIEAVIERLEEEKS